MIESEILQAAMEGLVLVFAWPNILYPFFGTLAAILFSLLPGLSGLTLMAMAIPFTIAWPALHIMLTFGAFLGGATFMGSITAILLNIPGTAPNAATLLDGHPMALKGEAKPAIGCSATASALGSSIGVLLLILALPVMRKAIVLVGPPEFLMLALLGLGTIVSVSTPSTVKGLAMAGFGLLIALVGLDPRTAQSRFTLDILYLRDGIDLIPVFLGIFALAETLDLMARDPRSISGKSRVAQLSGSLWDGVSAVFKNLGLLIQSSFIGTFIGMIPGIGGTVAGFIAYGHASRMASPDNNRFGSGDIRGVLAPEAANDAKDGASLIPTLAFGVPGNEGTALLLAVLTLHGLVPGKELMTTHLHLVFALIWSLFFSNWLTSLLGLGCVNQLVRLTVIPLRGIAPPLMLITMIGAYGYKERVEDVLVAVLFGILGYYLKKFDWPRVPLVIALVLGPLFENNLHITLKLQHLDRINIWTRPVAMGLLVLTVVAVLLPWFRSTPPVRKGSENARTRQ